MSEIAALFRIGVDPFELVLRGSAIYWFLFLVFRFVLRRDTGSFRLADVLLLVLVADASQNAMSGGYESVTDGAILVATIVGWNYLLDWASFRSEAVRRFVEPPPLRLIRDGRLLRANMRREMVTVDELQARLREHGIERFDEVKSAVLESEGEISVIRNEPAAGDDNPRRKPTVP